MKWELIEDHGGVWSGDTYRLPVPGGWLYRCRENGSGHEAFSVALVFVPMQKGQEHE